MENFIYEVSPTFNFSELSLANPAPVQGGSYFTKLSIGDKNNLFIQMPKCKTKAGIVKTGKKYYCDLLFSNADDNILIQWLENLENRCRELICEKKDVWFQNDLEDTEIDTMLAPSMRLYKSGKSVLVRVFISGNHHKTDTNSLKCTIYDENENIKTVDDIISDNYLIPLVWFSGIKFTTKEFRLEVQLNQLMLLDDKPLFDINCRIKRAPSINNELSLAEPEQVPSKQEQVPLDNPKLDVVENEQEDTPVVVLAKSEDTEDLDKTEPTLDKPKDLEEIDINYDKSNQEMSLKDPTEVYVGIYKAARKKAKQLKTSALEAILEAKNIKSKYMLDDLDIESSDDESELDNSLGENN